MVRRISSLWMGKHKDVQQRTRKAAAPAQQAARSSVIARKAAGEKNNAVEAAVAARATCQASLLGGSRPRAGGATSSSQDNESCRALPSPCPHTRSARANAHTAMIMLQYDGTKSTTRHCNDHATPHTEFECTEFE